MPSFNRIRPGILATTRNDAGAGIFGAWREGSFDFHSPAAREEWHHAAYAQGVDPDNWHLGQEMDAASAEAVAADLGGSLPPSYRGPDGQMRFGNRQTAERPALRDIRQRAVVGKSMDDLEAAYRGDPRLLPGAAEAVAFALGRQVSSTSLDRALMPANSNVVVAREMTSPTRDTHQVRALSANAETKAKMPPDLLLAQAELGGDGTAGTAPSGAQTDRWRDEWRDAGIPPHVGWQSTYPGNAVAPRYAGELKSMSQDPAAAAAAEAAIRHLPRASHWPVDGKKDAQGRRVLNAWDSTRGQGDGRYGLTRGNGTKLHNGLDIAADVDDPVYAVKDGVVAYVRNDVPGYENEIGFGNEVIILHDDGTFTQYGHMGPALDARGNVLKDKNGVARIVLKDGQVIKAGQQIGSVGRTGNIDRPVKPGHPKPVPSDTHLHFEVRIGGAESDGGRSRATRTTINPYFYLPIE